MKNSLIKLEKMIEKECFCSIYNELEKKLYSIKVEHTPISNEKRLDEYWKGVEEGLEEAIHSVEVKIKEVV